MFPISYMLAAAEWAPQQNKVPAGSSTFTVAGGCRYRHTAYHKQTKNQWARDDPAYVIICCVLLTVAGTAYCVT